MELIAQRREARRLKALREKAALNEERKQHGDDLNGVRFARMVDSERRGLVSNPPPHLQHLRGGASSAAGGAGAGAGAGAGGGGDGGPRVAVMVRKR